MVNFKFVINEPETKKSYNVEVDQTKAASVIGKKIGDDIDASFLGLNGYTLKITGGSDRDGFPMHPSVQGAVKKKTLLSGPPGFHPELKGQRKRKTVRGNTISQDTMQINAKVVKKGEKSLAEMFPAKEKPAEKKEEKPVEKPKEEKQEKPAEKAEEKPKEHEHKKEEPAPKKEEPKPVEVTA